MTHTNGTTHPTQQRRRRPQQRFKTTQLADFGLSKVLGSASGAAVNLSGAGTGEIAERGGEERERREGCVCICVCVHAHTMPRRPPPHASPTETSPNPTRKRHPIRRAAAPPSNAPPPRAVTHLAPEMFMAGSAVTPAVDAYAFGVFMYELYTRKVRPGLTLNPNPALSQELG